MKDDNRMELAAIPIVVALLGVSTMAQQASAPSGSFRIVVVESG